MTALQDASVTAQALNRPTKLIVEVTETACTKPSVVALDAVAI